MPSEMERLLGYLTGRLLSVEAELTQRTAERDQLFQRLQQLEQSGPPDPSPAAAEPTPLKNRGYPGRRPDVDNCLSATVEAWQQRPTPLPAG